MQTNSNFERIQRKERNERPPRGNNDSQPIKRGKAWERDTSKRQWDNVPSSFDSFQ